MSDHLEAFFEPKSVVVIGASATPRKPGNDVIRNILANGFEGELHLVNPKGGKILGRKVWIRSDFSWFSRRKVPIRSLGNRAHSRSFSLTAHS